MEVDDPTIEELFSGLTIDDELRNVFIKLFTELIDGELPSTISKEVERILEAIVIADQELQQAQQEYDFCQEFAKDFSGKDCEKERLVLEQARARNKAARTKLQAKLNQSLM